MTPDKIFADQHGANPQSWNLYTSVRNNPVKYLDLDGQSTITFDGQTHTITLYSANGTMVAAFPAFNNVCYHATEDGKRVPTNGPMTDRVHHVIEKDEFGATSHLGDHKAYGPNGIIHVQEYWGVSGDSPVSGAVYMEEEADQTIVQLVAFEPLMTRWHSSTFMFILRTIHFQR